MGGGGGGLKLGEGSRGPLRPFVGPGQSPDGGFRGAEGKRFSVFEMPLEGSPL